MRKAPLFSLATILFAFAIGIYLQPKLPAQMATHWGVDGTVNGYSSRAVGTFALPVIMTVMWVIFQLALLVDPKKKNIEAVKPAFDRFMTIIFMFMEYLYLVTLAWNMGKQFDFLRFVLPTFAVVYYGVGDLIEEAKPNWTIGVRSPWTLSSDTVWEKTNKVAGQLFKYAAATALLTLFFPADGIYLVIAPAIAVAIISIVYSYVIFRREAKR